MGPSPSFVPSVTLTHPNFPRRPLRRKTRGGERGRCAKQPTFLFSRTLSPPASGGKESSQLVPRWISKKRWKEQGTNTVHTSVRTQIRVSSAMEIMKMFGRAFGGGAPAAPVSKEEAADQPKGGGIQSVHGDDQEGLRGQQQQQHLRQQQQQPQQEVPLRKKLSFQPPDEGGGGGRGGGGGERGSLRSPPVVSNGHSIFR